MAEQAEAPAAALAAAFSRGGEAAAGETLLLLSDLAEPQAGSWAALQAVLAQHVTLALTPTLALALALTLILTLALALTLTPTLTLIRPCSRGTGVGIAGAKVVDEQGRTLHAGLDVALGEPAADRLYEPDALASTWHGHARSHSHHDHPPRRTAATAATAATAHGGYGGYGHGYGGYGYGGTWRERDTAVPVHRWQGLLAEPTGDNNPTGADEGEGASGEGGASASLTGGERVLGVALAASAVRTALWRALGGLNESMPPDHAALDLSLRARQLGGHATVYVNASVVVQRSRPEGDPTTAAEASGLASLFEARWGSELEARIAAR